jgi:hypothetical protein
MATAVLCSACVDGNEPHADAATSRGVAHYALQQPGARTGLARDEQLHTPEPDFDVFLPDSVVVGTAPTTNAWRKRSWSGSGAAPTSNMQPVVGAVEPMPWPSPVSTLPSPFFGWRYRSGVDSPAPRQP